MSIRNVRLGIVYRGSIVREEILDRRIDVSVGQRADSTLQFSPREHPDFPEHLDILFCEKNVYYLVVPSDQNARINLRGAAQADKVETIRGRRCIRVDEVAGGSVVVGDLSIMFQFVRGYSTPTAVHDRTVLRIGLVYNERLISDRIFPHQKSVSIGGQKVDTVVLDQDDYKGPTLQFVNNKDGSVTMKSPSDMNIRAAVKEEERPRDLKELLQAGHAKTEGNTTACHLALGTRGRAIMGPYTVLFQVVRQRVVVPAMERKTVMQRFIGVFLGDAVWTACFGMALLLGGGVVVQALLFQSHTGQYLKKAEEEKHISQVYEVLVEEKEEVKEPEPEPEPENVAPIKVEEPKEVKEEKATKAEPVKQEKPESTGKTVDPEERKRHAREVVSKKTIAGAFMDAGGASTKLFADGGEGEGGEVQAKTFGGDAGEGGAGPGGALKLKGGGGGGTIEKIKGGKGKGFGKRKKSLTKVKPKKKEAVVKVKLRTGDLGGSGAGKAGVARVIARKNSAVRRCYEAALRDDPGLSGKVKVRFTVGTAGTITSVSVLGASGAFSGCIKGKFSRIRGLPLLPSPQSFNQSYVFTKS